jgi:hypothetical protein
MEQLIILVIIGVISLINWLIQKSAEGKERNAAERGEEGDSQTTIQRTPTKSAENKMRDLMEALGMPLEEAPPRPLRREAPPPPLPTSVSTLQDLERRLMPEVRPRPVEFAARPVTIPAAAVLDRKTKRAASAAKMAGKEPVPPGKAGQIPSIQNLLRSQDGLRKSVVLSEVLGPPKGMI